MRSGRQAVEVRDRLFSEPGARRVGQHKSGRGFEPREVVLDARLFHVNALRPRWAALNSRSRAALDPASTAVTERERLASGSGEQSDAGVKV